MNKKYTICFVCTGNACRSPFAECVTKDLLRRKGIEEIEVFSLGTLNWGRNPRDTTMVDVAREIGYELDGVTTHMTREALAIADRIIVFDAHHRDAITYELDYDHWDRIVLFNTIAFGTDEPVEDPHYQSLAVYKRVAQHIEEGCKHIVENLLTTLKR